MKTLVRALVLVAAAAPVAAATQVRVRQGTDEVTVEPIQTAQSVSTFYAYDTVQVSSAFTGLETSETSLLFFHEDTSGGNPLSLVVLHDRYDDGSGGSVTFDLDGLPAGVTYAVRDDPFRNGDTYAPDPPAGGATQAVWNWQPCCTDGLALTGLEGQPFCVQVEPQFFGGIDSWQALSGPGLNAMRHTFGSLSQPVFLCKDCQTLSCPAVVNAECDGNGMALVSLIATGASLCGGDSIANDRNAGGADASDFYPIGATTVTFTLVDAAGFQTQCQSQVLVEDTTAPEVVACPAPLVLPCQSGPIPVSDSRVQAWIATFAATDVCSSVTLSNDAPAEFPTSCSGTPVVVTFTATDLEGNPATCPSSVTVVDQVAPVVTCPGPLLLECTGPKGVPASDPQVQAWLATFSASDTCSAVTTSNDAPPDFPSSCAGTATTVHFHAQDACGNGADCSATLTVHDTTPPSFTAVPAPITLECNAPGGVPAGDPQVQAFLAAASAADLCDGAVVTNDAPPLFPSGCGAEKTTVVTFTAADACPNVATAGSSITVHDTTPPALVVPAPLVLECTSAGGVPASDPQVQAWLAAASASDICDGATISNDAPVEFPSGCGAGEVTTVKFTAVDDCGNASTGTSTVTVVDTLPPVVLGCALRPAAPPAPASSINVPIAPLPLAPALSVPVPPPAPRVPRSPQAPCLGPSSAWVKVDCGAASDACDPAPTAEAKVVLDHHEVTPAGCLLKSEEVAVDCGELVLLVRLAPPCPARPPRSPRPAVMVRSDGLKVLSGEGIRLEVRASDGCGNVSAPCIDDATAPGGPVPCPPKAPRCPTSLCGM